MKELLNFLVFLKMAYDEVSSVNQTLYVRTHDVRLKLGISKELMQDKLTEIWKRQLSDSDFPYSMSIEVDLSPLESWRLRKQKMFVDGFPANIMMLHKK